MKRPHVRALEMAAEWLDVNEGSGDEEMDCKLVAEWLRELANKAKRDATVRRIAQEANVPLALARQAARKCEKKWKESQ